MSTVNCLTDPNLALESFTHIVIGSCRILNADAASEAASGRSSKLIEGLNLKVGAELLLKGTPCMVFNLQGGCMSFETG